MSRGDSYDTFSGSAITLGDGSQRFRAFRIERDALASSQPGAVGIAATGSPGAAIALEPGEVKLAEVLNRPEVLDLQVFVVQIEGGDDFVALAEREAIVNYPIQHLAVQITDWGDPRGESVQAQLDAIAFDDGSEDRDHDGEDSQRRTSADREQAGRHAHHPARRQRAGSQGGWVG